MPETLLVITTVPDQGVGERIARTLIERGLAACVNIGAPVTSIYRWQGGVEQGRELMLTIKTTRERYAKLERAIVDDHPYELPEVIAVPVTEGLSDYLAWIEACTKS